MSPKKRPRPVVSGGRPPRPINLPRRGAVVTLRNYVKGDMEAQMREHPFRWKQTDQDGTDEPEAIA